MKGTRLYTAEKKRKGGRRRRRRRKEGGERGDKRFIKT